MTLFWVLVLGAVLVAIPFVTEAARKPMDKTARAPAPGAFAALPQGVTHLQWRGPEDGQVIVCIHGLTTPSFVWTGLAGPLADAGYRVLTYDLFGRGYSDRPKGPQTPEFFLRQLDDILASQNVTGEVSLIGYSMGGVIATGFAARHPSKVRRVVLLAPAGMWPVSGGLFGRLLRLPGLGAWLMLARYPAVLRKGLRAEAHLPGSVPGITRLQENELTWRGFVPAVHASLRDTLTNDLRAEHEAVARAKIPVLAIWGGADAVIPIASKDRLQSWNGHAKHHVIADAGHGLTYTHTPQVLDPVLKFLTASGQAART